MARQILKWSAVCAVAAFVSACSPPAPPESIEGPAVSSEAAATQAGGHPIASGGDAILAFDGDHANAWVSPERGGAVRGHSWIGYAYDVPRRVLKIVVAQTNSRPHRQDALMAQYSIDGGVTWVDAAPAATRIPADVTDAQVPVSETAPAATHWRVLASGDNSVNPETDAWTPHELSIVLAP